MRQFDVAVFDLDGTILDTSEGVLESVRYTINHFGFEMPLENEMTQFIGPPIQNSFAKMFHLEGDILQEIATVFRTNYKDVNLLKAKPYEGIYDVFEALVKNGVKPAIATYKRQDYATTILKHFGFDQYTDIMYGADHENRLKKSDIIMNAIGDSGVIDLSKVVMIGDSDNDAIGAANLNVPFVGVTYGFGFKSKKDVEVFPSVGIAEDTIELRNILVGESK